MALTIAEFRRKHYGEAMVVCGLGSSLPLLADPFRFRTIGVNDIERAFTPDYMFCMDALRTFTPERQHYIQNSRARYIFTSHDLGIPGDRVVRCVIRSSNQPQLDDASALHLIGKPSTSPFVAVCLALHMGAKAIGLIGVDFTRHHFFATDGKHRLDGALDGIDRRFYDLGDAALRRGTKIFNLSPQSRLRAFPRLTPDEFYELAQSGRPYGWSRPAERVYFFSEQPVALSTSDLVRRINTETSALCRVSAPEGDDIQPGFMPLIEQRVADDAAVELDCETAPLPADLGDAEAFQQVWRQQLRPMLFGERAPQLARTRSRSHTWRVIVSALSSSLEETERTVRSLQQDLRDDDEIIVLGHTLSTAGPAPVYCTANPPMGEVVARNWAASECDRDLLLFTDANVHAPLRWAAAMTEAFRSRDVAAAGPIIADMYRSDLRSYGLRFADAELSVAALRQMARQPYAVPLLPGSFLAVRREAFVYAGEFDTNIRASGADNLDLCMTLQALGGMCVVVPEVTVAWRDPFSDGAIRPQQYWPGLLEGLLYLANKHLSSERLGAFLLAASAHREYQAASAAMLRVQASTRRFTLLPNEEDWFFTARREMAA